MNHNKDLAICLRKTDYSETSQIVTLFCRESGKISAIAKGARRKKSSFGGPIEIFSYGQIIYTQSDRGKLATLTDFDQLPKFQGLSRKLISMHCGMFAAELVNWFCQEHDPHPELFNRLEQFLSDVQFCSKNEECVALLIIFQLGLLSEVGGRLIFTRCANCKTAYSDSWPFVYFSSAANGFVCPDCEASFADKRRVGKSSAEILVSLQNISSASRQVIAEIESVLVMHFTELMHKRPKMAKYFAR